MNDFQIFIIIISILVLIGITIRYLIWNDSKKDKKEIDILWRKFINAEAQNNYSNLQLYGNKLIWNKYIKLEQLERIHAIANSKKLNFTNQKFEELSINAYNKILIYKKTMPQSGSSGGIKQSW